MFCRKCGKMIPDDSKFCPYCGETVVFEETQPAVKETEHGYCSQCGNPLPEGKLAGLCDDCLNKIGIETAEYGRCENCGRPLESDDGTLCKDCVAKLIKPYTPKVKGKNLKMPKSITVSLLVLAGIIASVVIVNLINVTPSTADANDPPADDTSSVNVSALVDSKVFADLRSNAQSAAIAWTQDNMQQYGKISDGHFEEGYDENGYILLYQFRSPNAFGANELHKLYLNYKKESSNWKLVSAMLDGDETLAESSAAG